MKSSFCLKHGKREGERRGERDKRDHTTTIARSIFENPCVPQTCMLAVLTPHSSRLHLIRVCCLWPDFMVDCRCVALCCGTGLLGRALLLTEVLLPAS